jgi:uncharacterized protein HemX
MCSQMVKMAAVVALGMSMVVAHAQQRVQEMAKEQAAEQVKEQAAEQGEEQVRLRAKPAAPAARASGYLKIGDIKGEASDRRYEKPGLSLQAGPQGSRWQCDDGECTCKGALDCKALLDSGKCKGKTFWEDGDDPSVGGCG